MKSVTENVVSDVLCEEHQHAIVELVEVKDNMPHRTRSTRLSSLA